MATMTTMELMLPELDRRKTQAAVEAVLEKYRIYKTIAFEEREVPVTASYTERFHGATNVTGILPREPRSLMWMSSVHARLIAIPLIISCLVSARRNEYWCKNDI